MPPPQALYHSTRLSKQIPANPFPTWSNRWLWSCSPSWLWLPGHLTPSLRATEVYRHATTLSLIPFNSSQRADSSWSIPDPIRQLAVELSFFLTCWELQRCHCCEWYTIRFVLASGFKWCASWLNLSAGCGDIIHSVCAWTLSLTRMFTTMGHKHATASSHTSF